LHDGNGFSLAATGKKRQRLSRGPTCAGRVLSVQMGNGRTWEWQTTLRALISSRDSISIVYIFFI
jgi:hypothetical protein